jgi:hypothetical protein
VLRLRRTEVAGASANLRRCVRFLALAHDDDCPWLRLLSCGIGSLIGLRGGAFRLPILIFVFGADVHIAGSAVLFVLIPTVRWPVSLPSDGIAAEPLHTVVHRSADGTESFVSAAAGGTFAGTTSAEVLTLMLGIILVAGVFKTFWKTWIPLKNSGAGAA